MGEHCRWIGAAMCLWSVSACGGGDGSRVIEAHESARGPDDLYATAEALANRGDDTRAEQYASLAVSRGYPLGEALPLLLRVCVRSSRITAALSHAQRQLRVAPEDHGLRVLVASFYAALSREAEADRELGRVLAAVPDHATATQMRSELLQEAP